jgi:enterochelin esterase-like enzyme
MKTLNVLLLACLAASAQKVPADKLIEMAQQHAPGLEQALRETLGGVKDKQGKDALERGSAVIGDHADFLMAVLADTQPMIQVDWNAPVPAVKLGGLWIYQCKLKTGTSHKFVWLIAGKEFGGNKNVPAYIPDSYPQPGVPEGKMTGPIEMESQIYPKMKANVWYYVPAQWDGSTPLPVQVWGDGQSYVQRMTNYRVLEALDNLTAQKKIPLMVNVFVQPGTAEGKALRSIEYDSVNDNYARYILEEILPAIGKSVKLRQDGYSRAMVGESSGGICAFNAAFRQPQNFARVLSWIGSFAALQVSDAEPVGGAAYPVIARREPKRNIRVWMQDGSEDQENPRAGSWPLANIELANSLKLKGYDYHFSFGVGEHNQMQGSAELPESLIWLWREYDPAKTTQEFVQEQAEKDKPLWRVVSLNRN